MGGLPVDGTMIKCLLTRCPPMGSVRQQRLKVL